MRTWVVRLPNNDRDCWIGNAETAVEAVQFAIARGRVSVADRYIVFDHDLNQFEVDVRSRNGSTSGSGDAGVAGD